MASPTNLLRHKPPQRQLGHAKGDPAPMERRRPLPEVFLERRRRPGHPVNGGNLFARREDRNPNGARPVVARGISNENSEHSNGCS